MSNIINEKVESYVHSFYRPLSKELLKLREDAEDKNVPIILKDTESTLLGLMRIKQPLKILEIGTAVGYSASCFAYANQKAHITTIELDEEVGDIAKRNIQKLGFDDRIDVLIGDGRELVATLDGVYDFVFIDAGKSHYKQFFEEAVSKCSKDAVIVADNVLFKGRTASDEFDTKNRYKTSIKKMREFLEYITNLEYADTTILSVGDGISVTTLRG